MNPRSTLRTIVLTGLCLLGLTSTASAQEQFRAPTWSRVTGSAGLRLASDNLGVGLGARAGYTLPQGIYVGGQTDYFFGENSLSALSFMAEGGYDFGVVENLVLRPVLLLGLVDISVDNCSSCGATEVDVGLGGQAYYYITPQLNVGGELRVLFGGADFFVLGGHVGTTL